MALEIIVSASAPYSHQSKGYYKYLKTIKQEFTLADPLNQILIRDNSDQYLRAAALQNMDDAGKQPGLSPLPLLSASFPSASFFPVFYSQKVNLGPNLIQLF